MNDDIKRLILFVIVLIVAMIISYLLVFTGNEPSYVLTCDNAETLEAYKSCMYLNNKIN